MDDFETRDVCPYGQDLASFTTFLLCDAYLNKVAHDSIIMACVSCSEKAA